MTRTPSTLSRDACKPRFATERTDRQSAGGECEAIAIELGVPLMPWQRQVLDVALEYESDLDAPGGRRYTYRECLFGTPRQSGKSTLAVVKWLHRCVLESSARAERLRVSYSMQSGHDARRKLMEDYLPMVEDSSFWHAVSKVRRASGFESIIFRNGSSVDCLATGKSSGHGRTLDEAWLDEAMHDADDRREQAVFPTMATRRNAQLFITSTAGTDESLYWRRKVDTGRKLVVDGETEGTCYFEWGFGDEDCDPYDEDVWWQTHPALGRTIPIEVLRHASKSMREDEFRRAFGNQWTRTDNRVIDWSAWVECRNPEAYVDGDLWIAIDVNANRDGASICSASAGPDRGDITVELIDRQDGIGWVVERSIGLWTRHNPRAIIVDGTGPIGALIPELERAGLPLQIVGGGDMPRACGAFYDHILERRLRVRPNNDLDAAVAAAQKRIRSDAFTWMRRSNSGDISPLVAATLATWGIAGNPQHEQVWLY